MKWGLLVDEAGSIVTGDDEKHKLLVSTVASMVAKASPAMKDFRFTALAIVKGWYWLETITDHVKAAIEIPNHTEAQGERLLFAWAEKGSVMTNGSELQVQHPWQMDALVRKLKDQSH